MERVEQCLEGVWYVVKVQSNVCSRLTFWPVFRLPNTSVAARFVRVIEAKLAPVHNAVNLSLHVPSAVIPLGEALRRASHKRPALGTPAEIAQRKKQVSMHTVPSICICHLMPSVCSCHLFAAAICLQLPSVCSYHLSVGAICLQLPSVYTVNCIP